MAGGERKLPALAGRFLSRTQSMVGVRRFFSKIRGLNSYKNSKIDSVLQIWYNNFMFFIYNLSVFSKVENKPKSN
jgi:hypothetical protein